MFMTYHLSDCCNIAFYSFCETLFQSRNHLEEGLEDIMLTLLSRNNRVEEVTKAQYDYALGGEGFFRFIC